MGTNKGFDVDLDGFNFDFNLSDENEQSDIDNPPAEKRSEA